MEKVFISNVPSNVRLKICEVLTHKLNRAEKVKRDAADAFVASLDEQQRSASLVAQGEINALKDLYHWFDPF